MDADVFDIEHLASRCGVNPLDGFRRAGLSTSNFYRWKQGADPKTSNLSKWKVAIIKLAIEEGRSPSTATEIRWQILLKWLRGMRDDTA